MAVDFTVAAAAVEHMRWCASHGVHAVVGTTGIGDDELAELRRLVRGSAANCVIAANFAIGAVLMMRFAELAAPFMDGVEIFELHHDGKLDAPSGTALHTADRLGQARRAAGGEAWPADRTASEVVAGARGGEGPGGVRIHSVRLPGLVAHQEVLFGAVGQSLGHPPRRLRPHLVHARDDPGREGGGGAGPASPSGSTHSSDSDGRGASLGPMDGPRQRILEATYACVARWGLSKTTVEDAAREAGLSRATVYRYFPGGRDELIDAVVSWQFLLVLRPPLRGGPRRDLARGGARARAWSSPGGRSSSTRCSRRCSRPSPTCSCPS